MRKRAIVPVPGFPGVTRKVVRSTISRWRVNSRRTQKDWTNLRWKEGERERERKEIELAMKRSSSARSALCLNQLDTSISFFPVKVFGFRFECASPVKPRILARDFRVLGTMSTVIAKAIIVREIVCIFVI